MFKDIMSFLKSTDENGKRKKISPFIIILTALIVILPTTIALLHAYLHDDSDVVINTTVTVALYDAQGTELAFEEIIEANIETSSVAKIFHGTVLNKVPIDTPANLGEHNFKLDFKRNEITEQFFCFFTDSFKTSYLKDSNGNFFSVSEEDYNLFLNSDYSEKVYPQSAPPKLITGDEEAITPNEATWSYLKQNGQVFLSNSPLEKSTDVTYNISGAINLHFYDVPDACTAQIFDEKGEIIYSGTLDELAFVKPQTDTLLRAKVSATWNSKDGRSSYGQATYTFNIVLGNKAEFSVSKSKVTAGDFVIVSVKNAQSIAKVIYSAHNSPDEQLSTEAAKQFEALRSYKPIFISDGDSARAIIPFHAELPSGKFTFSVAYGATEQEFTIEIRERQSSEVTLPKVAFQISPILSQSSTDDFNSILKNLNPSSQSIRFFRGKFASPQDFGFVGGYRFKDTLKSSDNDLSFDASGAEFTSPTDSTAVKALNIGVVLESSYCQYLGNYVVIEHGMGLRTWYCGLSDATVKVGAVVAKGDLIGRSGDSPTVSGNGFVLMCSVYDTLVSPDVLWSSDFNFDNK